MKIALLHGARVNAGDFLILERSKQLLKHYYPECMIREYYRNESLEEKLEEINLQDILIFVGGPGYMFEFYPENVPLVKELDKIRIPIMIIGMGWFGNDNTPETIYRYDLGEKMRYLLKRVANDTKQLGCRDYFSVDILRNNGLDHGIMTGCPAWYDLDYVNQVNYTGKKLNQAKKICVSDCGNANNFFYALNILTFLRKFFAKQEIYYVFHRGNSQELADDTKTFFEKNQIQIVEIAHSDQGFHVYDDCDLHIGFRVHAHIYNLSKRKLSILIEEDGRGAGINDVLGMPQIHVFAGMPKNEYLNYQIEDCLMNWASNDYVQIEQAYGLMNRYYKEMEKQILMIEDIVGRRK